METTDFIRGYKNAFKKSEILYQERLDAIKQLNSCSYYLSDIPLFEFDLPEHNLVRNKKGKKVVVSKKFEDFFKKHTDKPWDWYELSEIQISLWNMLKNIQINHGIGMDFHGIQISPWKFVEKYPDKPWNWYRISRNPNITMEIIEKYPDKPWNWNGISYNPNITMEFIEKYPDKPWDW